MKTSAPVVALIALALCACTHGYALGHGPDAASDATTDDVVDSLDSPVVPDVPADETPAPDIVEIPLSDAADESPATQQTSCGAPAPAGCGLVHVAGGTFSMGEVGALNGTPVQSSIAVSDFEIDAYEVTVGRFRQFVAAGMPSPPATIAYPGGSLTWSGLLYGPGAGPCCNYNWTDEPGDREAHPVNDLTWEEALAFCVWDGGRLPTEAEWEDAARWLAIPGVASPRTYPWGDEAPIANYMGTCDRAQTGLCTGDDGAATRRVGSFAGPGGLFDLAGNVAEFTADGYRPYSDPGCWGGASRMNPLCPVDASALVSVRGGAWNSVNYIDSAARDNFTTGNSGSPTGVRCARSL